MGPAPTALLHAHILAFGEFRYDKRAGVRRSPTVLEVRIHIGGHCRRGKAQCPKSAPPARPTVHPYQISVLQTDTAAPSNQDRRATTPKPTGS